jgi:hypothetical protein
MNRNSGAGLGLATGVGEGARSDGGGGSAVPGTNDAEDAGAGDAGAVDEEGVFSIVCVGDA